MCYDLGHGRVRVSESRDRDGDGEREDLEPRIGAKRCYYGAIYCNKKKYIIEKYI
jgi:hypothetical protein